MNKTDKDAIRADLLHLLLTNKGERLYLPEFGSDLKKFIFKKFILIDLFSNSNRDLLQDKYVFI